MKTEFRIGNIIQGGTILELQSSMAIVSGGNISGNHGESYDEIVPIPLTQEWLERFGFTNNSCDSWRFPNRWDIHVFINNRSEWYIFTDGTSITETFHFVHQLQNLYFALTNTELTVK